MTISDGLVIIAILLAPYLAVQIQKYMEDIREKRARKIKIFRTLMETRANPLNPQHVEALNVIDIEFYENQKIVDAWKLLLKNYLNFPKESNAPSYQAKLDSSVKKSDELRVDLLYEMAKSLNYSFDKDHLKRVYAPKSHTDFFFGQEIIRRGLVDVFLGRSSIPIKIINPKNEEEKK